MAPSGPRGFASAVLAAAGIRTLYGSAAPGLPVTQCDERIAGVLARAHMVVRNRPAAGVAPDGTVDVVGRTGAPPQVLTIDSCSDTPDLVARVRAAIDDGGAVLRLAVDPDQPWPPAPDTAETRDPWSEDHATVCDRIQHAGSLVILAGPGVVAAHAVPGLHALAGALGSGVLNTWGAKGIFHWRSRHHWATIGLQEQDFSLAGIDQVELVIATGVDAREAPRHQWEHRDHVVVDPTSLAALAEAVAPRSSVLEMPALRARLAAATQARWGSTTTPLAPSQVTLHYGRHLAGGGLVAADAGVAGFWVARTFATTELGGVAVPPQVRPGWAAACVAVARLSDPLRPALAVVDERLDQTTQAVLEFARGRGIPVGAEVWTPHGDELTAEEHETRLAGAIAPSGGGGVTTLATDPTQLEEFVAAAGPVSKWEPPPPPGA